MKILFKQKHLLLLSILIILGLACALTDQFSGTSVEESDADADKYTIPGLGIDVSYEVSEDGVARFWLEDYPDIEPLTSQIETADIAFIEWKGVVIDGYGELGQAERQTLTELFASPYSQAVPMIALERGCRADGYLNAEQLAALLYPWQMHLKYSPIDRMKEIQYYFDSSTCAAYYTQQLSADSSPDAPFIMISNAAPFPVVYGYFPFDPEGAFEMQNTSSSGCVLMKNTAPVTAQAEVFEVPLLAEIPFNQKGPCGSRCRGACGIDCTLSNCTVEDVFRCFTDAAGENTGYGIQVKRYTCGVHQACVTHDACYDDCNRAYGCHTFWSAWCSHGTRPGNCDGNCFADWGYTQCVTWARGKGPFEQSRRVFDYTDSGDPAEAGVENLEACPAKKEFDITKVTPVQFTVSGEFEETLLDESFPIDLNLCSPGKGRFTFTFWNVGALAGSTYASVSATNTSTPYFEYYLADWPGETEDRCVTIDYGAGFSGGGLVFSGGPNGTLTLNGETIGYLENGQVFVLMNTTKSYKSPNRFNVPDPSVFSAWNE